MVAERGSLEPRSATQSNLAAREQRAQPQLPQRLPRLPRRAGSAWWWTAATAWTGRSPWRT